MEGQKSFNLQNGSDSKSKSKVTAILNVHVQFWLTISLACFARSVAFLCSLNNQEKLNRSVEDTKESPTLGIGGS